MLGVADGDLDECRISLGEPHCDPMTDNPERKPRKPKPPVDRLKAEYIHRRFGLFLKHWKSHAEQRIVRKMLLEYLRP